MKNPSTLKVFSENEFEKAHFLLAWKVASMMGRKFEEGDWAYVYCSAKNIPYTGWSNLNIDIMHKGLGVEHKMLCVKSKVIKEHCGTGVMHPAATRSIRVPSTDGDPTAVAREVLSQYAELIMKRRQRVAEDTPGVEPDLRTGLLLWQESLKEFLYFETEMLPPNPDDYWAEWKESGGGTRKTSKNLWVYEKTTGKKRYSITTTAGAKIQPYFDIPPPNDPHLYYFCVQGEELQEGVIRIWITGTTALLLHKILGSLDKEVVSSAIVKAAENRLQFGDEDVNTGDESAAQSILITKEAYEFLRTSFPGVSDEHMVQLLIRFMMKED